MDESVASPRLGRESVFVGIGALLATLAALRVRADWTRGVIGGGDAWQNLWNLVHVDGALRGRWPVFFSPLAWAPEGAGLFAHTLSVTNAIPGAVLARLTGFALAYNALVVFSFVLASVAMYRLSRRLGFGITGSALAAFVFAFAPQHEVRALGHLNLLGTGWIPLALEGLVVAARSEGRRAWGAAVGAAAALVLVVFADWYLALLGALAAICFTLVEIARAEPGRRRRVQIRLFTAGAIALAATLPAGLALSREAAGGSAVGHDPQWCSCAITSLFVPSPAQLVSALTVPLTRLNSQSTVEGAAYLGFVPLLATLWTGFGRRREKALLGALLAGGIALVLALGPKPRLFDHLVKVPLPYWFLEKLAPALRLGGCVNRLQVLAFLALGLGTAAAADRLLSRGRRARLLLTTATLVLVVEYAPIDPGVSLFPYLPPDPAMLAIRESPEPGAVLDVDPGVGALVRQLRHGRPQTFGYLSKAPTRQREARLLDPVLGPFLDPGRKRLDLSPTETADHLRRRWGVSFIVTPDVPPFRERAARLGLPVFSTSPASIVYRVPGGGEP